MKAVDDGIRVGRPSSTSSTKSRVVRRAEQSGLGSWSEDLGRWGHDVWNLPGFGDRGPRCGEYYPEAVCDTCGEPSFGTHTCGRRSCPDCWGVWAKEAAVRATTRIQSFRHTEPDGPRRQAASAVVAPPEGAVRNEREFWAGRKRAAEIAEEKGWRGFVVVPHPWRVTDEGKNRYKAADPDYGIWVWLRTEVEDWREFTYWSPHYHIAGVTSPDMEPGKESDEWLYEFTRSFERYEGTRDRSAHEDVYGKLRYLLSHTGYPEGSDKQVVTWYGCLANSVFVEDATEEWQYQKPSEGVRSALKREIEDAAGVDPDDDADGARDDESDDRRECLIDGCGGELIDVFDVRQYLRRNEPPPDVSKAMMAALEWRIGERPPPAGLKRPQTEAEAREAFEAIL